MPRGWMWKPLHEKSGAEVTETSVAGDPLLMRNPPGQAVFAPIRMIPACMIRSGAEEKLACISHHPTVEAREKRP